MMVRNGLKLLGAADYLLWYQSVSRLYAEWVLVLQYIAGEMHSRQVNTRVVS